MSDLKIDETTGLPEVPKGMFWRVRERDDATYLSYLGKTASVYVDLVQKATVTTTRKQSLRDIISFQKPVLDKLEVTNVVESCGVFTDNDTMGPNYPRYYAAHELTPELILETATKVLERYLQKEAGNKLLGDYPPKSIISLGRQTGE